MSKSLAAHILTVIVTLTLAFLLFNVRTHPPAEAQRNVGVGRPSTPATAPPNALPPNTLPNTSSAPVALDADEQVNVRVYAAVNRSVVNITISATEQGLFGEETSSGTGSGFIIDSQGHILTNYHVIEGADHVQVTLADGSNQDAWLVGTDPSSDAAVLQIKLPKGVPLVPLRLGRSAGLLVGQKVLAVGNPFGLERTLTTGIVSALDRTMKARNDRIIKGIIQTDAAINPGNSGGPLLNTRGEVIGMTTAIISRVSQSAGIGFAVPSDVLEHVIPQLIANGHVIRADIGIRRAAMTDAGLLVTELVDDGPAAQAGIEPLQIRIERVGVFQVRRADPSNSDFIQALDGKPIKGFSELLTEVESKVPGTKVTLTVSRKGKTRDVVVTLGGS